MMQASLAQRGLAAAGVGDVGVAAIDDGVAGLPQVGQLVDHGVGSRPGCSPSLPVP
jgi:hypothetical protein